jgi:hypothetical protein
MCPWRLTGTGCTAFDGAIGHVISTMSTPPWRAATRHPWMAARAYVRVQRATWLE